MDHFKKMLQTLTCPFTVIPYVTLRNIEDFADQYILPKTYLGVQHLMNNKGYSVAEIA